MVGAPPHPPPTPEVLRAAGFWGTLLYLIWAWAIRAERGRRVPVAGGQNGRGCSIGAVLQGSARQRRHDTVFNVHGAFHRDVECKEVFRVRRREPPTPYGRDPGRRGVRSPGTGGKCGPFGTVIRHPVPPPQSPTRRPPRQLPVSTVKARPCPVCAPLRPAPAHLSAIHRRAGHRRRSSEEPGRAS